MIDFVQIEWESYAHFDYKATYGAKEFFVEFDSQGGTHLAFCFHEGLIIRWCYQLPRLCVMRW